MYSVLPFWVLEGTKVSCQVDDLVLAATRHTSWLRFNGLVKLTGSRDLVIEFALVHESCAPSESATMRQGE